MIVVGWAVRLQNRLNALLPWRVGLFAKIALPVMALFVLFSGAIGVWVSRETRRALLEQTDRQVAGNLRTAHILLEAEWEAHMKGIGNPALHLQLGPLISRGMTDHTAAVLKKHLAATGLDVIHGYDAKGVFLASSAEYRSSTEPKATAALLSEVVASGKATQQLILLPAEVLVFEGLDPGIAAGGAALSLAVTVPITDEFGDPAGYLLGLRFLPLAEALLHRIGDSLGAEVIIYQGSAPIASTFGGDRSTPVPLSALPALTGGREERLETSAGRLSVGSETFHLRYLSLTGRDGRTLGTLATAGSVTAALRQSRMMAVRVLLAGVVAVALFSLLLALIVQTVLLKVGEVVAFVKQVSSGDLSRTVELRTRDEVEPLAAAISETVVRLRGIIGRVEGSFRLMEQVAGSLGGISEALGSGTSRGETVVTTLEGGMGALADLVERTVRGMEEVRGATDRGRLSLEAMGASVATTAHAADSFAGSAVETASSMQEMAAAVAEVSAGIAALARFLGESIATMHEITQAAAEIRALAAQTRQDAGELAREAATDGRGAMTRADGGMQRIRTIIESLGGTVRSVRLKSDEIGEITQLIADVADQTNLLALNASILAAQAQEHGRGFGVVAQEVRSLSRRTEQSVKKIAALVGNIQEDSRKALTESEEGIAAAREGVKQIGSLAAILERIIAGIDGTRVLNERIAGQTDVQSSRSAALQEAMQRIEVMSRQLAGASAQQHETSRSVLGIAEAARGNALGLKDSAKQQTREVEAIHRQVESTAQTATALGESAALVRSQLAAAREGIAVLRAVTTEQRAEVAALLEAMGSLRLHSNEVREHISIFSLGRPK